MSHNPGSSSNKFPPAWERIATPDGKTFYRNAMTGETTWNPPQAMNPVSAETPKDYRATPPSATPQAAAPQATAPQSAPHSYQYLSAPFAPQSLTSFFPQAFMTTTHPAVGEYSTMSQMGHMGYRGGQYQPGFASVSPPGTAPAMPSMPTSPVMPSGAIFVNGLSLDAQDILRLQSTGAVITPGRYWYDNRCGAWGYENGPCQGIIAMGLSLGGPLRSDASGPSSTGVFINGRQIHTLDALRLQGMGVTPIPGRWWLEADGRYGIEGSFIPIGNLRMQAMAASRPGYGSWGDGRGNFGGRDGQGFGYVGGTDSTGHSWSVSYGG